MKKTESVNLKTGQIIDEAFNKVIIIETKRPDGSVRIQQDFSNCPTMSEQHTAHLTDINYLIDRYKPDELASYLAARTQYRQEIIGHDFSKEPTMQQAMNVIYHSRKEFEELPDQIKYQFKNHVEFLKFIDNPLNANQMLQLGILTPRQLQNLQIPETNQQPSIPLTQTQPNLTPTQPALS